MYSVRAMETDKQEAFHFYAKTGSYLEVYFLVNEGIDLNRKDSIGRTPLMSAARRSYRVIVELLINSGADIHCCDNLGWTVLHHAVVGGSVEIVQCLVNKGVACDIKASVFGSTPLMEAASLSKVKVFELLIDLGADIHCCSKGGKTVLHYASFGGSLEIVQCLVNKGADVNKKCRLGQTPLIRAVSRSNIKIVELLINSGADMNCCDSRGRTALHHVWYGSVEIYRCFVNRGVALDMKNREGATPLMLATHWNDREVLELLINSGADVHCCDNDGWTVLHYASIEKSVEIVQCLLNEGVKSTDSNKLLNDSLLKKIILQDIELCFKLVVNKYNNRDLPLLYKWLASAQRLPPIDKMKIGKRSGMALEVKRAVTHEIQVNGFCNVFEMVPLVLGMSCVKSLEKSRSSFNKENLPTSQHGSKRIGEYNEQDYACKKMRN